MTARPRFSFDWGARTDCVFLLTDMVLDNSGHEGGLADLWWCASGRTIYNVSDRYDASPTSIRHAAYLISGFRDKWGVARLCCHAIQAASRRGLVGKDVAESVTAGVEP